MIPRPRANAPDRHSVMLRPSARTVRRTQSLLGYATCIRAGTTAAYD